MSPNDLIPLSDHDAPSMPTEHSLRTAWRRLQRRIGGHGDDDPVLPGEGLESASLKLVDDLADPPACAPILQALEDTLGTWTRDGHAGPRLQLVVVPPCDRTGVIATWARSAGHALLPAPPRTALAGPAGAEATAGALADDGLLVVPRLEQWFLRQHNGLRAVRALLAQLSACDRRCVVACDSWAWAYLVKAADAELQLPRPRTFQAFDAPACGSGSSTSPRPTATTRAPRSAWRATERTCWPATTTARPAATGCASWRRAVAASPGWPGICGARACSCAPSRPACPIVPGGT